LRDAFQIVTFFETGSYYGLSTRILAEHFEKVYSCEANRDYWKIAKQNNQNKKNVVLKLQNSSEFLRANVKEGQQHVGFFLDAHCDGKWPLLQELEVIAEKKIQPVILIHDFFSNKPHLLSNAAKKITMQYVNNAIESIYGLKFSFSQIDMSKFSSTGIFHAKAIKK
jgi:hypothetical protein